MTDVSNAYLSIHLTSDSDKNPSSSKDTGVGAERSNDGVLASRDKTPTKVFRAGEHEENLTDSVHGIKWLVYAFGEMDKLWTSGAAVGERQWLEWCTRMEAQMSASKRHISELKKLRSPPFPT